MTNQGDDAELAETFKPVAQALIDGEEQIISELNGVQGSPVDLDGYYRPCETKTAEAMRPSKTLNAIIDSLAK